MDGLRLTRDGLACPHCPYRVVVPPLPVRYLPSGDAAAIIPASHRVQLVDHIMTEHPDRPRRRTH